MNPFRPWLWAGLGLLLAGLAVTAYGFDLAHSLQSDARREAEPIGGDFWLFWAAGRLAVEGRLAAAYDPAALSAVMAEVSLAWHRATPFSYPPPHLLLLAPFGALPYLPGYALYFLGGLLLFMSAVWAWTRQWWLVLAMLGFSGIWVTLVNGQNGLWVAGLFGWAVFLLRRQAVLAGVLIGCLTLKPQLGLMWPVALLAGRAGRAFLAVLVAVLVLAAGAVALAGVDIWRPVVGGLVYGGLTLNDAFPLFPRMPSFYIMLRLLNVGAGPALALQGVLTLMVGYAVFRLWRLTDDAALRLGLLASATLLSTPYLFGYDLVLLAWPLLVLALQRGVRFFERGLIALAYVWPLLANKLYGLTGVQWGWVIPMALLLTVARRIVLAQELRDG